MENFDRELETINAAIKRRSIFILAMIILAMSFSVALLITGETSHQQKSLQLELQAGHNQ